MLITFLEKTFFSFLFFFFLFLSFGSFLSFSFFFFSFVFFKKCTIFVSTLELVGRWLFYFILNPLVFSIQSNHTIILGGFLKTLYGIMDSFRVVCVNDSAKPNDFVGSWIQKDKIYTVVDAKNLARQRIVTSNLCP